MVTLYTLPNCPICNMVKTKLAAKSIEFKELNLENYIKILHTDRAPVLCVEGSIYNSPSQINDWIKAQ